MIGRVLTRRQRSGFTLIELLIVVIIVGILVAIGVPAYLKYTAAANDRDAQAALQVAYKAAVAGDTEVNTAKFPVATTIVNDIVADEPAASVVRGSCVGTVATVPAKRVVVDTSSTSTQVVLCTKSASGAIWKLSGPLTGSPTVADGSTVAFTIAAGDVSDISRAASLQGDGLTNDSSTGVWQATTNLLPNGGFESGTANWANSAAGASITADNTKAKFGAGSLRVDVTLAAGARTTGTAFTAGSPYTCSSWVWAPAGHAMVLQLVRADFSTIISQTLFSGTGSWQRASASTTSAPATETAYCFVKTTGAGSDTFWIDGAQVEQKPFPTPYVETNGAAASRANGNVQAPAALISATQGWVAMRVRVGWAAAARTDFPQVFDWQTDTSNRIGIIWNGPLTKWSMNFRNGGGGNSSASSSPQSFTAGTTTTLIGVWYGTTLAFSTDGSAFQTAPNAAAVVPSGSTFELGSLAGTTACDCDILWAATGVGTLTDTDAATIGSWGNNDPKRSSFPAAAQATMAWDGTSSGGSLK